jgi:two-component system chemotaxis response regulator CheY
MRTLLVDPSAMSRRIARFHLDSIGFDDVVEAPDLATALDRLDADRVELVVTAWTLDDAVDATPLLRIIRDGGAWSRLPVLVMASSGRPDDIREAMVAGADACVVKPLSEEALRRAIEDVLEHLVVEA